MNVSNYTRRDFIRTIGLGAAAATLPRWAMANDKSGKRPNIIFILADDHAAHAVGCYGSRINQTPNLDRMAREGVRFTNCFCTNSICAPSRATILTGKYGHVTGQVHNRSEFDVNQATFPQLLRSAGYETALIGKWHMKHDPANFDYWNILPGQGVYHDPEMIEMGVSSKRAGYTTDILTDESIKWIGARSDEKPFLLLLHHKAPHRPWQSDDKHASMFEGKDVPEPPTFDDDYATRCEAARHQAMSIEYDMYPTDVKAEPPEGLSSHELKQWKYQRYIKDYLRCIASVDDNVGRLLDYLDRTGLSENTLVVYTSDQGFFLGDHGWYDKRFMYEESLRMPLLMRFPGMIKPGSVNEDIVLNLDFASTFLDLAGQTPPADMQGESFAPILRGQTPADWRKSMYYHYYEYGDLGKGGWHRVYPHYGLRTRRYKLIHFYDYIDAWELYDLERDPQELKNVYADPAYAEKVKMLKAELQRLRQQYGDSDQLTRKIMGPKPAQP